jgi:peptide/nickel transport system substrate-binding protein
MKGDFDMSMYFGNQADTPYVYYRNIMSSDTVLPVGTDTGLGVNMWRYSNKDADAALLKFASTSDPAVQKEAAMELQKIFADNAPVIPMYYAPTFYCYNDKTVTGWPNAENPYAYPMPIATTNSDAGQLIVLTTIYGK